MVAKDYSAKDAEWPKAQVFGLHRLANRPLALNFLGQVEDKRRDLTCNHAGHHDTAQTASLILDQHASGILNQCLGYK